MILGRRGAGGGYCPQTKTSLSPELLSHMIVVANYFLYVIYVLVYFESVE